MLSLTRYCGQFSKVVSLIPAPISGIWDTHWLCVLGIPSKQRVRDEDAQREIRGTRGARG